MKAIKEERTLVLVKPDGVMRGLSGEVISRIEQRGLKVIAMKMVAIDRKHLEKHFPSDPEWVKGLGKKTMKTFDEYNIKALDHYESDDHAHIGAKVKESLFEYMSSGPIVAMVVEGIHSIDMVRKIAGDTLPVFAPIGSVRGDYSVDSPAVANVEGRAIKNIMHASETPEEAKNEIDLWFKKDEIHDYKRAGEDVAY
ncbi:nucleoside-diphosphate kinase [Patescibacteria group bacterium]|nr:nucleoside-diphosphate kinase [Patescibacteria group bacterium]